MPPLLIRSSPKRNMSKAKPSKGLSTFAAAASNSTLMKFIWH
ncbi:hypothetical protein TGS27_1354 [Geobacillus stearothermophilus]|uniref:Uncharacterized protein n=1 Tax=Geobacillus stearothermophilus TaxID=1422 RepID=A0ABQ7HBN4_GEOSE|nr:hypothetical protein GS8_3057 [Geobacillus stearothermophilus]OAO82554.1 hypothetical protein TGS27_1354 [Geobacillus stearothermophilus]